MTHKTTIMHAPSGLLPGHPQEYFWWRCSCGAPSTPHHPIHRVTDRSEVEAQARRRVTHRMNQVSSSTDCHQCLCS
jgi:hypothetical protein